MGTVAWVPAKRTWLRVRVARWSSRSRKLRAGWPVAVVFRAALAAADADRWAGATGLSRWGDYSAMTVDPTDDCTFWYTQEYLLTTGTFDWNTGIVSFTVPGCGPVPNPPTNLKVSGIGRVPVPALSRGPEPTR